MTDKHIPQIPDDLFDDLLKAASKDLSKGRQRIKNDWILKARALFEPSERQPCHICLKFQAVTQAHHIIPLADQYDRGFKKADQEHVWLCPNHHDVLHRILSFGDADRSSDVLRLLEGFTRKEVMVLHALLLRSRKGLPSI